MLFKEGQYTSVRFKYKVIEAIKVWSKKTDVYKFGELTLFMMWDFPRDRNNYTNYLSCVLYLPFENDKEV